MQRTSRPFPWLPLGIALAVYSVIQLAFLGLASIYSAGEARQARAIDAMFREGDWLLPMRNGEPVIEPPLYRLVGALFGMVQGDVSELTARLPAHLAALGVLLCCAVCAYRLALLSRTTESALHAERVACISVAFLSLTYGFHQGASRALSDMVYTLCVWGACTALLMSDARGIISGTGLTSMSRGFFWTCCAAAVLAGGPFGFVLPVAFAFVGGAWLFGIHRAVQEVLRPSWGWLGFLVPVLWYSLVVSEAGTSAGINGIEAQSEPWWFYLPWLFRATFPWGLLAVVLLFAVFPRSRSLSYGYRATRFVLAPVVLVVLATLGFSLLDAKGHLTVLPLLPFVSIEAALLLSMVLERGGMRARNVVWGVSRRAEVVLALVGVAVLVCAGLALHGDWSLHPLEDIVKFSMATFAVRLGAVLLIALGCVFAVRKNFGWMLYSSVWMLMVVLMTVLVGSGAMFKSTLRGFRGMAEQLRVLVEEQDRLIIIKERSDEYFEPLLFYLRKNVDFERSDAGLPSCDPDVLYCARRSWVDEHTRALPGAIREVAVLQETLHAMRRDGVREIVVFRCSPSAYPDDRGERKWHDARLREPRAVF